MSFMAEADPIGEATMALEDFCNACFSVDRKLSPAGDLLDVFYSLFENRGENLVFRCQVTLCWECLAVLKKVRDFKMNVFSVQNFLYSSHRSQSVLMPQCLTNLVVVSSTCEMEIKYEEEEKHEAKLEPSEYLEDLQDTSDFPEDLQDTSEYPEDLQDTIKVEKAESPGQLNEQMNIDVKEEVEDDDIESDDDNDSQDVDFKLTKSLVKSSHKNSRRKPKFKWISRRYLNGSRMEDYFSTFPLNEEELEKLLEEDRKDPLFVAYPHRCDKCMEGWFDRDVLIMHIRRRHSQKAGFRFRCHTCSCRFRSKGMLEAHTKAHYVGRQCNQCEYKTSSHHSLRRHVLKNHLESLQCLACGICLRSRSEFDEHYKALHSCYICDLCGMSCKDRPSIKRHLRKHGPHVCCGRFYMSYRTWERHRRVKHDDAPSELAYCVECDRQYDSVLMYKNHIATSVKHGNIVPKPKSVNKKVSYPCTQCDKVYRSRAALKDHFDYFHLHLSRYKCQICDKRFPTPTRLREHRRVNHETGWPLKNKMCTLCNRGFSTNQILKHHMRTHTGEKPCACHLCDAKFAQPVALKSHIKHIHLQEKRRPAAPPPKFAG